MVKRIGIAFFTVALVLPVTLEAQTNGRVRTAAFKPKSFLAKSYKPQKPATSTFAVKKFSVPPYSKKSAAVPRGLMSRRGTFKAGGVRRTTRY